MRRMGLVDQLEATLEREISRGLLPRDGGLPSERTLAQQEGVSRSTAREALLRLQKRGLVVRHPGRRSRALPLDESLTLENLGVALHGRDGAHPERLGLLEGYFALKRDITVELLVACCESASKEELDKVDGACFLLADVAYHGHEPHAWALHEFEVLRMAARAARRPGYLLLIQSLERAFWGMASWVLPHLDSQAIRQWARCVEGALFERDARALRQRLPPLLEASDKRVLEGLAPASETAQTPEPPPRQAPRPPPQEAAAAAPEPGEMREADPAHVPRPPPAQAVTSAAETGDVHKGSHLVNPRPPHKSRDATPPETPLAAAPECPLSPWEEAGARVDASQSHTDSDGGHPPGAPWPKWSACQTNSSPTPPTGAPSSEPSRVADFGRAEDSRGEPLA